MIRVRLLTVCETALFTKQATAIWSETEKDEFIAYIAAHYMDGDVVPDCSGVRKIRWSRPGMGKRGGARVIYFYYDLSRPIFLLMTYAKGKKENLDEQDKKTVREFVRILKKA
jgi:hypothetical protein